ncbi:hypothetical protein [Burkholderia sp. Ac-20365]|uniref:hypothetical protein n=1 Tax=Burkholderia sp. Ac-20365 TaxID=2703897 RepID=UPI00197C281E|nr:hypothetical protein [Burkholderia sp. Ac-20365]MBN3766490.1 hypothetical protein [Burkholderia sp. Ac-20365]
MGVNDKAVMLSSVSDHNIRRFKVSRANRRGHGACRQISDLKRTREVCMMMRRAEKHCVQNQGKTLIFPCF